MILSLTLFRSLYKISLLELTKGKVDPAVVENPSVAVVDVVEGRDEAGEDRGFDGDPSGRALGL